MSKDVVDKATQDLLNVIHVGNIAIERYRRFIDPVRSGCTVRVEGAVTVITESLEKGADSVKLVHHVLFHNGLEDLIGLVIEHGDNHHFPHGVRCEGSVM